MKRELLTFNLAFFILLCSYTSSHARASEVYYAVDTPAVAAKDSLQDVAVDSLAEVPKEADTLADLDEDTASDTISAEIEEVKAAETAVDSTAEVKKEEEIAMPSFVLKPKKAKKKAVGSAATTVVTITRDETNSRADTISLKSEKSSGVSFKTKETNKAEPEMQYVPVRTLSVVEVYVRFFRFEEMPDTLMLERYYEKHAGFRQVRHLTKDQIEEELAEDSTLLLVDRYPPPMRSPVNYRVRYISNLGISKMGSAREQIRSNKEQDSRRALAVASMKSLVAYKGKSKKQEAVRAYRTGSNTFDGSELESAEAAKEGSSNVAEDLSKVQIMAKVKAGDLTVEIADIANELDEVTTLRLLRVNEDDSTIEIFEKDMAEHQVTDKKWLFTHNMEAMPSKDAWFRFDFIKEDKPLMSLEGAFLFDE